jgi:tRNA(Ile)-lysidine synthase
VIETIAINLIRGTGWRGLAVLDTQDILRPLLHATKDDLYVYALAHHLEWVEDSTNAGEKYLRNRVRRQINANVSKEQKQELLAKWQRQLAIKARITTELETHIKDGYYSRYFFTTVDDASAQEMLRTIIVAKTNQSPTRPQTERALLAIKTAARGAVFELGGGVSLRFGVRTFIVETS